MGGGSSKRVKDYVLHVEGAMELDSAAAPAAAPKPDRLQARRASLKGGTIQLPVSQNNDTASPNTSESKSNIDRLKDSILSVSMSKKMCILKMACKHTFRLIQYYIILSYIN